MSAVVEKIQDIWAIDAVRSISMAVAVALLGLLIAKIINRRLRARTMNSQARLLVRRFITAVILILSLTWALSIAGVNVGILIGTAGFLTVAIGFAAQTSVSNLISGMFLMAEQPFKVGDVIEVSGRTGSVIAIDLLSVKLRTFDNLMVRIPNETMLKSDVVNLTHFEIRRYDLQLGVAYDEEIEHVRQVLFAVADSNTLCLREPKPQIIFIGFGESSINLQFSVWAKKESFLELRNSIAEQVKNALDQADITIPFPHRVLRLDTPIPAAPDLPPRS